MAVLDSLFRPSFPPKPNFESNGGDFMVSGRVMVAVADKGEIARILDTGPPRPIEGHAVWSRLFGPCFDPGMLAISPPSFMLSTLDLGLCPPPDKIPPKNPHPLIPHPSSLPNPTPQTLNPKPAGKKSTCVHHSLSSLSPLSANLSSSSANSNYPSTSPKSPTARRLQSKVTMCRLSRGRC